ncbi:hypothetical protein FA13DRAFT_1774134 [Coprinellus micaceus]|uniref:Uncharacterized protein n=1 Tax=Coprinellus micaceus TaxID=71717 RepID=A0A4Y7TC17_COPMI|nr:hypothetical protein FA13DRAFT_1774134 [Coprinellus micaceus]
MSLHPEVHTEECQGGECWKATRGLRLTVQPKTRRCRRPSKSLEESTKCLSRPAVMGTFNLKFLCWTVVSNVLRGSQLDEERMNELERVGAMKGYLDLGDNERGVTSGVGGICPSEVERPSHDGRAGLASVEEYTLSLRDVSSNDLGSTRLLLHLDLGDADLGPQVGWCHKGYGGIGEEFTNYAGGDSAGCGETLNSTPSLYHHLRDGRYLRWPMERGQNNVDSTMASQPRATLSVHPLVTPEKG